MNIIKYPLPFNEIISRFQEAVNDFELRYCTADLYRAGIETETDMNEALLKTVHTLRLANLDTNHYLKRIYITEIESGKVYLDWRMNKLVFFFVILNSECQNRIILHWKKKILNTIIA
jgi:hypothetical protein